MVEIIDGNHPVAPWLADEVAEVVDPGFDWERRAMLVPEQRLVPALAQEPLSGFWLQRDREAVRVIGKLGQLDLLMCLLEEPVWLNRKKRHAR